MKTTVETGSTGALRRQVARGHGSDSVACGIALRDMMAREVYYGMNLAMVLSELHETNPALFADIQTVMNRAFTKRS